MSLVLDAGAFIAVESADRSIVAAIKLERESERAPLTHGGIVGQVWRSGDGRQAMLARLLAGVDVRPLDSELGRHAGRLLARTSGSDVIDAALVAIAADGDRVLTSDPHDLRELAEAAGVHVDLCAVS